MMLQSSCVYDINTIIAIVTEAYQRYFGYQSTLSQIVRIYVSADSNLHLMDSFVLDIIRINKTVTLLLRSHLLRRVFCLTILPKRTCLDFGLFG